MGFACNGPRLYIACYLSIGTCLGRFGLVVVEKGTISELLPVFLSGQAGLSGGFSWRTKPKQNILFTKKVSKVRNINHIQLNHRSPAIAVFHPSTRPRLMQADAGFLNHVQASEDPGRAGPPLAQAFRMGVGPLRNTGCYSRRPSLVA